MWLQSFGTRLQNRIFAVAIFSVSKLWLSSKWFYDFILLSLNSKWYHNSYGCSSDIIFQMWNPKFSLLKIGYWNSKMTNKNIKFIQIFIGGLENDLKPYGRYVRTRIIMIKLNVYILALYFKIFESTRNVVSNGRSYSKNPSAELGNFFQAFYHSSEFFLFRPEVLGRNPTL